MSALDLAPHEQLDEIDRRTNEDGTVDVELLKWQMNDYNNRVDVHYRIPTGEVKTESMQWPEANDPSYKFIRLIEHTPYNLRTAESINDSENIRVKADPSSWDLVLPEDKSFRDYIPEPNRNSLGFEVIKVALYPLTVLAMFANVVEKDAEYVGFRDEPYQDTYLENRQHHIEHIAALKSAAYLTLWLIVASLIIL